jgi:hypothetical protein
VQAWQGARGFVPFGKIDDGAGTPPLARNASVCRWLIREDVEGGRRLINAAPNRQQETLPAVSLPASTSFLQVQV